MLRRLKKALERNDSCSFLDVIRELIDELKLTDEAAAGRCQKQADYINNQWDAAAARLKQGMSGSCTEAQIKHTASCRMSTIPKSWNTKNAGHLAALRVAYMNGIDICHPKPEEQHMGGYIRYMDKTIGNATAGPHDWSIFGSAEIT